MARVINLICALYMIQVQQLFHGNDGWQLTWWRHQMETFSALLVLCARNSPVTGEFPAQRSSDTELRCFFDLRLNKRLSKKREAGDLRRHRAHYDVIVMNASINESSLPLVSVTLVARLFEIATRWNLIWWLSGVPDYFGRNKISSGGDLSHYSSASLY